MTRPTVLIALNHRFAELPNGSIWTRTTFDYTFWSRYRQVFDTVLVLAPVEHTPVASPVWQRSDGPGVRFIPLPNFRGVTGFLRSFTAIRYAWHMALLEEPSLVIGRAPSPVASLVLLLAWRRRIPNALEIVGDPREVLSRGALAHPLRPFLRWISPRLLRLLLRQASGAAYVTHTLRLRYPIAPDKPTQLYSSINLPPDAFSSSPASRRDSTPLVVGTVASLAQPYKGVDVLLRAARLAHTSGHYIRLLIVGGGRYQSDLESLAESFELQGAVTFTGQVPPGEPVRTHLDHMDIFCLPSRTEGLPRALIEAMARGLPCIATRVGGIPDLLGPAELVPPDNPEALAHALIRLARDPTLRASLGTANIQQARNHAEALLTARRNNFYRDLLHSG